MQQFDYSSVELVHWQSCLDAAATQVEVDSSHVGMGWSREVWTAVAAELNAPAHLGRRPRP
jgi:hypothetical protein